MVVEIIPPANAIPVQAPTWAMTRLAYYGMQVNGSMEVSQQYGSTLLTMPAVNFASIVDEFPYYQEAATVALTAQQVQEAPPGYQYSLKFVVETAEATLTGGGYSGMIHKIEGYRCARLLWGTAFAVPLSFAFWVRSNVGSLVFSVEVYNPPAYDRSYVVTIPIYAANVWEYKTCTIPGCTDGIWGASNTIGVEMFVCFATGPTGVAPATNTWLTTVYSGGPGMSNFCATVGNTIQFTGVLLVPGTDLPLADKAPFIMRPFDEELQICQRYYEKSYDYATLPGTATTTGICTCWANNATLGENIRFAVMKRTTPTVTTYGTNGASGVLSNLTDGGTIASSPAYSGEWGYSEWSTACVVGKLYGWQWVANARL